MFPFVIERGNENELDVRERGRVLYDLKQSEKLIIVCKPKSALK